jgi:hypothetical protein
MVVEIQITFRLRLADINAKEGQYDPVLLVIIFVVVVIMSEMSVGY